MSSNKELVTVLREEFRTNRAMLSTLEAVVQVVDEIHGDDTQHMMECAERARGMIDMAVMLLKEREEKTFLASAIV